MLIISFAVCTYIIRHNKYSRARDIHIIQRSKDAYTCRTTERAHIRTYIHLYMCTYCLIIHIAYNMESYPILTI